ncbi:50S ribosomal protein L24 [Actinopolymorpha pittospori]|jgi:large subunit ribosomal protein L24|uniref:Large ribosomal subunit protein uL24 n=1 Tax=Actinopolymorpha pittospori TaxID=648752 RepID=A0A927R9A0_9ACTN|nr:50S ribosomal protein L24 [Actinopolymorpha pittospori]MBE1607592.1 large subunit ribosomal protein L24 [Actinopolymorpha pittospori]
MANSLHIKKGDLVRVTVGRDRGVEGKVIEVDPTKGRVFVEGANRVKRHTKVVQGGGRQGTTGGIVTQEASIPVSNVTLLVEVDGKKVPTRVGYERREVEKTRADGTTYKGFRSVRIARKTGEEI